MLQSLFVERFGLVVRRQLEDGAVFALRHARARGALGPSIEPSSDDCDLVGDGSRGRTRCTIRDGWGSLSSKKTTIGQLLGTLTVELGDLVEDQTELKGEFEISLEWLPSKADPASAAAEDIAERASLATALEEQLGLKVVRERHRVEFLVIEHRPPPN